MGDYKIKDKIRYSVWGKPNPTAIRPKNGPPSTNKSNIYLKKLYDFFKQNIKNKFHTRYQLMQQVMMQR